MRHSSTLQAKNMFSTGKIDDEYDCISRNIIVFNIGLYCFRSINFYQFSRMNDW